MPFCTALRPRLVLSLCLPVPYSSVWRGVFCWDAWHSPPIAKEPPFDRGVFFGSSGRLGFCYLPFLVWLAGKPAVGKNGTSEMR